MSVTDTIGTYTYCPL